MSLQGSFKCRCGDVGHFAPSPIVCGKAFRQTCSQTTQQEKKVSWMWHRNPQRPVPTTFKPSNGAEKIFFFLKGEKKRNTSRQTIPLLMYLCLLSKSISMATLIDVSVTICNTQHTKWYILVKVIINNPPPPPPQQQLPCPGNYHPN